MGIDLSFAIAKLGRGESAVVALTKDLDNEQARWRPAAGKWSILEIVNHLVDEERDDFRMRVDLLLHQPGKEWPPIDPEGWCRDRHYNERELVSSVAQFVDERQKSLRWLSELQSPDWQRTYDHASGPLRAGDVMLSWMAHDDLHLRQLLGLHHQMAERRSEPFSSRYAGNW